MSKESLFTAFPTIDAKTWKQKIQADLKGADYNDTLIWESPEGIHVKPFYSEEDLENITPVADTSPSSWSIGQYIQSKETEPLQQQCSDALEGGARHLILQLDSERIDLNSLLSDRSEKGFMLFLEASELPADKLESALDRISENRDRVIVLYDIIGHLASTGNWHSGLKEDFESFQSLVSAQAGKKIVAVDGSIYQNAGADRVQQLAYMIAHAKEYLDRLQAAEPGHITFSVSTDSNYFFEIAKLKALRLLWQRLLKENNSKTSCHILCSPSKRNKSIYDYNVNMLRTTTECMSAILGGADTVFNLPYDFLYHEQNDFADRIARNQLLILRNESYFDKVSNAATGSYYLESLCNEMVNKAWALYEQIQAGGGFIIQLKEHKIQKKIKESAQRQQQRFDSGDEVLLGCNKYPNATDAMRNEIVKDPFLKKTARKTHIEPILQKRLAESLEKNRLDHER